MIERWTVTTRPGFFGRRRDEIVAGLDARHGKGNWQLRWMLPYDPTQVHLDKDKVVPNEVRLDETWDFQAACKAFYEESYYKFLLSRPDIVEEICKYWDVYDNATTNVQSGLDYTKQEAYSTHIQDIAIRNVLDRLHRRFANFPEARGMLQVRGPDSDGWRLGLNPGQVPFFNQQLIIQPSLSPKWAGAGSVEDFWQSNKYILVRGQP